MPTTILIVDDLADNLDLLSGILRPHYRVRFATNGPDACTMVEQSLPDLILLDVMMPGMNGYEVCQRLKANPRTREVPVIFVSALDDPLDEEKGLAVGAVDFLRKPCPPAIVRHRVRIHLDLHNQNLALEARVRERTSKLEATRLEIVRRLGRAGEYRDNETGLHVIRMSHVSQRLAEAAGLPDKQSKLLLQAAPMHDVGKIGIPDRILLKPGKLDPEEWEIMKRHAAIGAEIIGEHDSEMLQMARQVALTHHEKWDGSGYPNGLAGEDIPIAGRIVSIADVFDALTSERPYKAPWTAQAALDYIVSQAGIAFDPVLVGHFVAIFPAVEQINRHYADDSLATFEAAPQ